MHNGAILIVEDDDDIREAMAVFLQGEGYETAEAANGHEALRLLRSPTQFCLVLLDLYMPIMNGWEFREEQLRDPTIADVPVIIVTADRMAALKKSKLHAIDYMVKPIDFSALLGAVSDNC